jgi:exopolysaccharide production protein ExoQ
VVLTFCLPLFGTWWMLYTVEHDFNNVSLESETGSDAKDLADEVAGSSALRQASLIAIGAIGALLLLMPSSEPIVVNRWLLGLMMSLGVLTVLSALWADDSGLTLKRTGQPILLMIAAAGIVKHLQPRQFCLFVVTITSGALLFGFIATCVNGTFLQGPSYRFGGTLHPNVQAVNCAALCLASLALLSTPSRLSGGLSWRWLIPLGIGLAFLYLTRSRTTTVSLTAAFAVFFILKAPLARTMGLVLIAALFIPVAAVLWVGADSNVSDMMLNTLQMGRDDDAQEAATLTGRIPIWTNVLSDVSERPLLGYGYGGFWTRQRIWEYSLSHHWQFNHAHSSYLETLLNVGVLGLALGILIVSSATWIAVRTFNQTRNDVYRFIAAVMTMALIHGFVDSNFVIVGFAPLWAFM